MDLANDMLSVLGGQAPQQQPNQSMPAPMRNNNPGAISPNGQLANYPDMETGLKAMDNTLQAYGKRKINTISDIISTYAPKAAGNDTESYINDVSSRLGIKPDTPVDLSNPLQRHLISSALILHENGPKNVFGATQQTEQPQSTPQSSGVDLTAALSNVLGGGEAPSKAEMIPTTDALGRPVQAPAPQQQPQPTALDKYVVGPLAAGTSMAVGSVAAPLGTLYGIGKEIVSGKFGTPEGSELAQQEAQKAINYLTPQPTSVGGQQALQAAGEFINNSGLQAIAPMADVAAALGSVPKGVPIPQLETQFKNRLTQAKPQLASVGAAAATDPEIAAKVAAQGSPELLSKVKETINSGEPVNVSAIERQAEATSLPDPIDLTKGQASQDLSQLSLEQNNRAKHPELAQKFNEQNDKLINNTNLIRENVAPDVYVNTKPEIGDLVIDAYRDKDPKLAGEVSKNYKALTDANGGQFPVDGQQLAQNIEESLAKNLKSEFLPTAIQNQLNKFAQGQSMTFENFEALRTNIASEIRKAERTGDGNAAYALGLARDQMEQLPLSGEAANLKPIADAARMSARQRFQIIKSDPIYTAFDKGTLTPDTLINKYIVGGTRDEVQTIWNNLEDYPKAQQAIKAGIIDHLKERANITDNKGNFGQAGFNKALQNLGPKLNIIFKPEELKQLQALGNTARVTQFFPKGSFVNTSNTLVGALASGAKKSAEGAVNYLAHGLPVGTYVSKKLSERATKNWVKSSVEPGAGIKLKDIGK